MYLYHRQTRKWKKSKTILEKDKVNENDNIICALTFYGEVVEIERLKNERQTRMKYNLVNDFGSGEAN